MEGEIQTLLLQISGSGVPGTCRRANVYCAHAFSTLGPQGWVIKDTNPNVSLLPENLSMAPCVSYKVLTRSFTTCPQKARGLLPRAPPCLRAPATQVFSELLQAPSFLVLRACTHRDHSASILPLAGPAHPRRSCRRLRKRPPRTGKPTCTGSQHPVLLVTPSGFSDVPHFDDICGSKEHWLAILQNVPLLEFI